jgi:hypothetical protein
MTIPGFPSVSAAERHLLGAGWSDQGDGTFWHGAAIAHVLRVGGVWSILITQQDVVCAPQETRT